MAAKPKPHLNIQCDWTELLRHGGEKAWVSCSKKGSSSVYGEITSHGEREEKELRATDGFEIESFDKRSITVSYPEWKCCTRFLAPSNIFSNIHTKSEKLGADHPWGDKIHGLSISAAGSLGVSSSENGDLNVWQTSDGTVRMTISSTTDTTSFVCMVTKRELQGHVTDVTTCRFFPSGIVILTGGSDMQLKIWSAEDASCPVTLRGHRGACSRDGTARLWDCGTSSCIGVITESSCPLNACAVAHVHEGVTQGSREEDISEREIGTSGKLLVIAREDNTLEGVALYTRQKVFEATSSSAFNTCCFTTDIYIAAGTQDGSLYKYDVRNTSTPVEFVQRTGTSILSMVKLDQGVLVATEISIEQRGGSILDVFQPVRKELNKSHEVRYEKVVNGDGSCFMWTDDHEDEVSLTGPDCDSVYNLSVNTRHVYSACRDGKIRKYIL